MLYIFLFLSQSATERGQVSTVMISLGSSFHHCGSRTANNQDFVEPQLGSPPSEGVASLLLCVAKHSREDGLQYLTMSLVQNGPQPIAAGEAGTSDLNRVRAGTSSHCRVQRSAVLWENLENVVETLAAKERWSSSVTPRIPVFGGWRGRSGGSLHVSKAATRSS